MAEMIPRGSQYRGTHAQRPIYFKRDGAVVKYYFESGPWLNLGDRTDAYLAEAFNAYPLSVEDLMDNFLEHNK